MPRIGSLQNINIINTETVCEKHDMPYRTIVNAYGWPIVFACPDCMRENHIDFYCEPRDEEYDEGGDNDRPI
jgi:hypothetical protein